MKESRGKDKRKKSNRETWMMKKEQRKKWGWGVENDGEGEENDGEDVI